MTDKMQTGLMVRMSTGTHTALMDNAWKLRQSASQIIRDLVDVRLDPAAVRAGERLSQFVEAWENEDPNHDDSESLCEGPAGEESDLTWGDLRTIAAAMQCLSGPRRT